MIRVVVAEHRGAVFGGCNGELLVLIREGDDAYEAVAKAFKEIVWWHLDRA